MKTAPALIAFSFFLLLSAFSNSAFSQKLFKLDKLMVLEDIAIANTSSKVKEVLLNDGWEFSNEGKTDNGYKYYRFTKGYWTSMFVYFTKDDRVMIAQTAASYQYFYGFFADSMKEQGFSIIHTIKAKNDEGMEGDTNTWGKKGYPFQFVADFADRQIYLNTKQSGDFKE